MNDGTPLGYLAAAWVILAAVAPPQASAAQASDALRLVTEGRSRYRIVIPADASETAQLAAAELQHFVEQISGARLPIVDDSRKIAAREIILGDSRHLRRLNAGIDFDSLGNEGFALRSLRQHLLIVGASDNGTLNGVYAFLEGHLGCRWLAADVSVIPKRETLVLQPIDDIQVPPLQFREVYYAEAMDPDFARRNRLNGNASIIENGKMVSERHRGWDMWCHSFFAVVPPDRYLQDHPEYFSLVDGKRQAKQLCVSNPDVLEVATESLKERMRANPEAQYFSVSQMDWGGACECENCRAVDEREGSPMGSLLDFLNKLAARFPDKTISTLSYTYTRRPPKNLRPAGNVLIVLCSIECNRSRPLATDPASASFREDVERWSEVCDRLLIWDYVVQFSNLVSPFPNLRVLQPNVQFFVEHGAKGMFAQGNREIAGEFAELRAYVLAKLLWDPYCDVGQVMDDFLRGYYGPAADPIREYIDSMHDSLEGSGADLSIYGGPARARESYLTEVLVESYNALFDEAEERVADDPELLDRVEQARMPLMFAQLELGYGDVDTRSALLDRFVAIADRSGLQRLSEPGRPPAEFEAQIRERLERERAGK